MTALLRYRCATPMLLAIVCALAATGAGPVWGQQVFTQSADTAYVDDNTWSQYDAPYDDRIVQTGCDGGTSNGGDCYAAPCDEYAAACDMCCEPKGVPVFVFGEFLFLRATDADVAYAQQQNGLGGAGTVPFGRIGTVDMDYEPAFRVGGGIGLDACSTLSLSYTRFDGDSNDTLVAPTVPGGGGAVGSLVHHPGAALTASPGPVDAHYDIEYQLADLLFRDVWRSGNCYVLNYSLGAQYANFDQEFAQFGNFGGSTAGAINTTTDIEFDGGGIKAGLDGERWLGGRLSIYAKASAAAISGRFRSQYDMLNVTTDTLLAESIWKDNRVISLIEYEIGLAVTSCNQRWRLSAGYLFQHWGNMVTTSNFIDGVQADNYTDLSDVISFDGFTTRLEARF